MEIQILTLGDNTDRFTQALRNQLRRDFGPGIDPAVIEPQAAATPAADDSDGQL